jgi:2-methylcitrate dehydratase
VQVFFDDGSCTDRIEVEVPLGHRLRREEAIPQLMRKFSDSVRPKLNADAWQTLQAIAGDQQRFEATTVDQLMTLLTPPSLR